MKEYKMCKKLKETGFPQTGKSHEWFDGLTDEPVLPGILINYSIQEIIEKLRCIYRPTLEEMITFLGSDFHEVENVQNKNEEYVAISCRQKDNYIKHMIYGRTAWEAVAKLCLEVADEHNS